MRKYLFINTLLVLACLWVAGCRSPLTGRNNDARVTIILEQESQLFTGRGFARTNAFDDVTHPGNLAGFIVINQHIWTDTAGNEEGTGRNPVSVPVDVSVPLNQNKTSGSGAAAGALADKALGALTGGGSNSTPADCPDGNCD